MFFDAHNHLQDARLAPHRGEIVRSLEGLPIRGAVVNGTREGDWEAVEALAAAHPWVIPSYGVHPWHAAGRTPDWFPRLTTLLERAPRPAGIGEIGLDRWKEGLDPVDQEVLFIAQLRLAAERGLPVTIHCLRAWGRLLEIVRREPLPARGFLLHAYGGPAELVAPLARLGAFFSFPGSFLAERRQARRAVFAQIPEERLLVETDAPDLPIPPERTRFPLPRVDEGPPLNHPANLAAVYDGLAAIRGCDVKALAARVEANFALLFGAAEIS